MLMMAIASIVSLTYKQAIINYLKKYLNEHLLTEIIVSDINFSLIKKFPYATVQFSDVVIKSRAGIMNSAFNVEGSDTLLNVREVFFQFDLLGLIRKTYNLKKIQILNGRMNLLENEIGKTNYSIWKSTAKQKNEASYQFEFHNVILSSIELHYVNLQKSLSFQTDIKKTVFSGSLNNSKNRYALKSMVKLNKLHYNNKLLFNDLNLIVDSKASYNDHTLLLEPSKLTVNKLPVNVHGNILINNPLFVDLSINISHFGLDELFSLMPGQDLKKFHFSGKGKLNSHIKGYLGNDQIPDVKADFDLTNGSVTNKNTRSKVSNIKIRGILSGNSLPGMNLQIENFDARLSTGRISGNLKINNFNNPNYRSEIMANIDLKNLYHFFELDTLAYLEGKVVAQLKVEGILNHWLLKNPLTVKDYLSIIQSGSFDFNDCAIKSKNNSYHFKDINGLINFDKQVNFQDFALTVDNSNFIITGTIANIDKYLQDDKSALETNLYIHSKILDLTSYLNNPQNSANKQNFSIPGNYLFKVKVSADELIINKFNGTLLKCELISQPNEVQIKSFNLKFIDGHIEGHSTITAHDSCLKISCNSVMKSIDIQQLFTAFNNFGQDFILDENLRGKLGGNVSFSACWDRQWKFYPPSLTAQADVEIINGELVKFEPMLSLSKYINVDELKHIKFKTLSNHIYIYNQSIKIPEMQINSSAFGISLSGIHSFSNDFDYRLKVSLSDVLFKKAKKKKSKMEEYLVMENNGSEMIIPISIIGNPDNYEVGFDSKRAMDLIRENIQREGNEFKESFRKNDTSALESKSDADNYYKIEWEDDPWVPPSKNPARTLNSKDDIQIKWEEEDSLEMNFFD
jgi:hypothetical protein